MLGSDMMVCWTVKDKVMLLLHKFRRFADQATLPTSTPVGHVLDSRKITSEYIYVFIYIQAAIACKTATVVILELIRAHIPTHEGVLCCPCAKY